jgi:hypothetical protein
VFTRAESEWRARLLPEEEIVLTRRLPGVSFGGVLRTEPGAGGRHQCRLLKADDHHCREYQSRPLECALYPLVLSMEDGVLKLYAHLACPFVMKERGSLIWAAHGEAVRRWLVAPANSGTLKAIRATAIDYRFAGDEIELLTDILGVNNELYANAQRAGDTVGEDERGAAGGRTRERTSVTKDTQCALSADNAAPLMRARPSLTAWLGLRKQVLSSRSFVSMLAWCDFMDFEMEEIDGNALILARQHGAEFLYCPPLGKAVSPQAVTRAFAWMKGGAARIEGVAEDELSAFDPLVCRAHEQGGEYYYERARIAALSGDGYRSRRTDINGFLRRNRGSVFRAFEPSDAAACHDLFDLWLDKRAASQEDDVYRAMLVENRIVHRRLIASAADIGLSGRVVVIDGRVAGYTFGYALNDDTLCVALEVCDPSVKGLPAHIFRELCADPEIRRYRWINAMDDFGMPGVARAKRSWRPAFMAKVYSICLKP